MSVEDAHLPSGGYAMGDAREYGDDSQHEAKVIRFPVERRIEPAPLPKLRRTFPTPGSGTASSPLFGAALTRRFDRDAA